MGKNQGHKATQRSRYTGAGGGENGESNDGMKDVSFHTAEWHAARIANLTVERVGWEEWRAKQKEAEAILATAAEEQEEKMREYRAQLNADRMKLLSRGRNHTDLAKELKKEKDKKRKRKDSKSEKKSKKSKKDGKDKDKKSKKSSKKRRRTSSDGSSSSDSDSDSSKGEGEEAEDPNKPIRLSDWLKM